MSDRLGFVGAFLSERAASDAALRKYPDVPFLVQKFPLRPGQTEIVWVISGQADVVLTVTNSRDEAERVQRAYARVGWTFADSVDYWSLPIGAVGQHALARLAAQSLTGTDDDLKAREQADLARLEALERPGAELIENAIRAEERISFMDCVVPVGEVLAQPDDSWVELPSRGPESAQANGALHATASSS